MGRSRQSSRDNDTSEDVDEDEESEESRDDVSLLSSGDAEDVIMTEKQRVATKTTKMPLPSINCRFFACQERLV